VTEFISRGRKKQNCIWWTYISAYGFILFGCEESVERKQINENI